MELKSDFTCVIFPPPLPANRLLASPLRGPSGVLGYFVVSRIEANQKGESKVGQRWLCYSG